MLICIAGKNEIAVFGLKLLLKKGISPHSIVAVTNKNDTGTHGWQPSFKKICLELNIAIVELQELYNQKDLIFISLEFDQIIRVEKFRSCSLYNLHFSLLPAYKGMFTSIFPILNGENKSGVTLHKIDNGIDTGDIIAQTCFELNFGITGLELYKLYLKHSKEVLEKNLDTIIGNNAVSFKQPLLGASYFSKSSIDFNRVHIDFNRTCFEVCNFVNAFTFRPYQLVRHKNYSLSKAISTEIKSFGKVGQVIEEDDMSIQLTTIDYNVILLKDCLEKILEVSSQNNLSQLVKFHENGFLLSDKNVHGWDSLIVASYNGSYDVAQYLVENRLIDINVVNNNGTSALMYAMTYACESNDLRVLAYLINKGANLFHTDYSMKDVFFYAKKYDNANVIDFLSQFK